MEEWLLVIIAILLIFIYSLFKVTVYQREIIKSLRRSVNLLNNENSRLMEIQSQYPQNTEEIVFTSEGGFRVVKKNEKT